VELRHLRYFVAIAEERSFMRAAGRLRVAQPALSKQIRDLELELGVTLFQRLPRGVRLTQAGESFLVEARGTLSTAERAVASVRGSAEYRAGHLEFAHGPQLTYAPTVGDLLAAFRRAHPHITLGLHSLSEPELHAALRRREVDVAAALIGSWPPREFGGCRLLDCAFTGVLLPAGYPLADAGSLALAQLQDLPLLFTRDDWPGLYRTLLAALRERGCVARQRRSGARPTHLEIAAGDGWMLANEAIAAQYGAPSSGIAWRRFSDAPIPAWLALLWHAGAAGLAGQLVETARSVGLGVGD
jgi:DNA-binding transcriptional LysR family regulator